MIEIKIGDCVKDLEDNSVDAITVCKAEPAPGGQVSIFDIFG